MDEFWMTLLKSAVPNGLFATAAIALTIYTIKSSSEREKDYKESMKLYTDTFPEMIKTLKDTKEIMCDHSTFVTEKLSKIETKLDK